MLCHILNINHFSFSVATTMSDLPRWNLTNIFPSLIAPEFVRAKEKYRADLAALTQYFDEQQIRRVETTLDTATSDLQTTLVRLSNG